MPVLEFFSSGPFFIDSSASSKDYFSDFSPQNPREVGSSKLGGNGRAVGSWNGSIIARPERQNYEEFSLVEVSGFANLPRPPTSDPRFGGFPL
jgi:hypothetical protein